MANAGDGPQYLKDGVLSFIGGTDASVPASQIERNRVATAINAMFRRGVAAPRPAFIKKALTFDTGTEDAFKEGMFQHGAFYNGTGRPTLLSSHGGRQFKVDTTTFNVSEITPTKAMATTTSQAFTIPAAGSTGTLHLTSTSGMYVGLSKLQVGVYTLTLVSVLTTTTATVRNDIAAQNGLVIANSSAVAFTSYDANSPTQPMGWSLQAQHYWILQDNQSYAVIFDGSGSRRANPAQNEIPVGNVMGYAMGRITVALPDRVTFRVGNLVFGDGKVSNILKFDENNYLNEGGDFVARVFGAPSNAGEIKAMRAGAMTDTQLGQGPLQVGTPNMVFTLRLPFDRTEWKNQSNALQTANPIEGPLGQCSTVQYNSDLVYRALGGVRSYILAQRQFGTDGNTPLSGEVNDLLEYDTQSLLEYGSAVIFKNRLLMTFGPTQAERGVWHRGLVVMDYEPISSNRRRTGPVWQGIWTGVRILQVVAGLIDGAERCFLYVLNDDQEVEVWEIDPTKTADEGEVAISAAIDFPSFNCGDSDRFKMLATGRIIVSRLSGSATVTVKYRTDLSACYQSWDSIAICAKNEDCDDQECEGPHTYRDQQRTPIKLRVPPDGFDPVSGIKYRTGYEFQPRIEIASTGYWEISQLRIYAQDMPESLSRERRPDTCVTGVECCPAPAYPEPPAAV